MSAGQQPQKGHWKLIMDIEYLLREAQEFQFDDFKNTKYPFPKKALHDKLAKMIENVVDGTYDN
jgi:hypothetical protein